MTSLGEIRARETIDMISKRRYYAREVEEEKKKGLREGEHYYTLYWGYSDVGGGDRRWMGSAKARSIEEVEDMAKNEILTEEGRKNIWDVDGEGDEWTIIQINTEDEERTEYIEIKKADEEKPDTSIFGDKTFWDLTN